MLWQPDVFSDGHQMSQAGQGLRPWPGGAPMSDVQMGLGRGVPCRMSRGDGAKAGRPCTVRSSASWEMVTWEPPPYFEQINRRE